MRLPNRLSTQGYRASSPDKNRSFNIIPSGRITMNQVPHPVWGIDDTGASQLMFPGMEYAYPGNRVLEVPLKNKRGNKPFQQGGTAILDQAKEMFGSGEQYRSPNTPETDKLMYLTDLANYAIASGKHPMTTKHGRILYSSGQTLPGSNAELRKLYDSIAMFNQRNDTKQLSPEQRLDLYYNTLISGDKDIESFKAKVKTIGYGVVPAFRNSPDIDIQELLGQPAATNKPVVPKQTIAATPPHVAAAYQWGGMADDLQFIGAQHINPFYANSFFNSQPATIPPTGVAPPGLNGPVNKVPFNPASQFSRLSPVKLTGPTAQQPVATFVNQPGDPSMFNNLAAAQWGLTGLSMVSQALEDNERRKKERTARRRNWTDLMAPVVPGSRGDYTVNEGIFKPDQYVPVQFGAAPQLQMQTGGYFDEPVYFTGTSLPTSLPDIPHTSKRAVSNGPSLLSTADIPARNVDNLSPNDTAREAFRYYVEEKGLAPHIAAGIIGNLFQESRLKPGAVERGHTGNGRGVAQWDVRDRWKGFLSWATQNGRNPKELTTQLDYILEEPGEASKALKLLKKTNTPEEAAYVFGRTYERPAEKHARWDVRTKAARQLMDGTFEQGGEYEVSPEQLLAILKQGGEVDLL